MLLLLLLLMRPRAVVAASSTAHLMRGAMRPVRLLVFQHSRRRLMRLLGVALGCCHCKLRLVLPVVVVVALLELVRVVRALLLPRRHCLHRWLLLQLLFPRARLLLCQQWLLQRRCRLARLRDLPP